MKLYLHQSFTFYILFASIFGLPTLNLTRPIQDQMYFLFQYRIYSLHRVFSSFIIERQHETTCKDVMYTLKCHLWEKINNKYSYILPLHVLLIIQHEAQKWILSHHRVRYISHFLKCMIFIIYTTIPTTYLYLTNIKY